MPMFLETRRLVLFERYLGVFEFTTDPDMLMSYGSLHTLFSHYKKMQVWNFEEESNGIDNLIVDLKSEKYRNHADLDWIRISLVDLETKYNNFKTIFNSRTQEQSSKEVFDVKQLWRERKTTYEKTVNYVLVMATAMIPRIQRYSFNH